MNIGVDIRCLMDKQRTGVGEYTYGLLVSLFNIDYTDGEKDYTDANQYFLFYNSSKDVSANIPKWEQENVHYVFTRYPNKILNLLLFLKVFKLDHLVIKKLIGNWKLEIGNLDTWFSPNLNFTSLSRKVKHILTIHDLSFEFFPDCFTWKRRLWHKFLNPRRQCQKADLILTPSENTRRDVANRYRIPDSKIQMLRPGISEDCRMQNAECKINEVKKKYDLPEKYILYLGTLEPRKNVETLIRAYKLSATSYQLMIAGSTGWKNKKILELIAQTPGVRYIGYVEETDKIALYQMASLFVYPSLYEGFGLPVLEAMAAGVPVITSNRSSLPEVFGESVYLVNPYNVDEIARAMKMLLQNEKLRTYLNEKSKKIVDVFKWNRAAADLRNIFQEIAK